MFSDIEIWQQYVLTAQIPVGIIFAGPGIGLDANTVNMGLAIISNVYIYVIAGLAIMNCLYASNLIRGAEQNGQNELVRAAPVGHFTVTTSAILTLSIVNFLNVFLVTVSLLICQLPLKDSLISTLSLFLLSELVLFIAAIGTEIFSTSTASKFFGNIVFFTLFSIQTFASISNPGEYQDYAWISPVAWVFYVKPFFELSLAPLFLFAGTILAAIALTYYLESIRDFGSGFITISSGRDKASGLLKTPFALTAKLTKFPVFIWATVLAALSYSYASMIDPALSMMKDDDTIGGLMKMGPDALSAGQSQMISGYSSYIMLFQIMVLSGFSISLALRVSSDETSHFSETLLAGTVSRLKNMSNAVSYAIIISVLSSAEMFVVYFAELKYVTPDLVTSDFTTDFFKFCVTISVIPVLFIALSNLLFSISPRFTPLVWVYYVWAIIVNMFGELLKMPDWLQKTSIFFHYVTFPIENQQINISVALIIISIAIFIASAFIYKNRDIN
jgi:ABC-2 type transport system permease protein